MTGIVGNSWSFDRFSPMEAIPSTVRLTVYDGGVADFMRMPLDALARDIRDGALHVPLGRRFRLDEIAEAHRCVEENRGGGKVVVLT